MRALRDCFCVELHEHGPTGVEPNIDRFLGSFIVFLLDIIDVCVGADALLTAPHNFVSFLLPTATASCLLPTLLE